MGRRRRLAACALLLSACACASRAAGDPAAADEDFIGWRGESFDAAETFGEAASERWIETLSWQPRAYLYHNFLSGLEADHLFHLAKDRVTKSMVVDNDSGEFKFDESRTSSGHFLRRRQDNVVERLEQRIADWVRLPLENGEPFHILRYNAGEQYRPHWDYFLDSVNQQNGGQRVATVLLYLSDVEEGGETVFPDSLVKPSEEVARRFSECGRAGVAVKPRKGDALLFWSMQPDSTTKDEKSLHAGCPVIKGDKWSATKWLREREHRVD